MKKSLRVILYGTPMFLYLASTVNDFVQGESSFGLYGMEMMQIQLIYGGLLNSSLSILVLAFMGITLLNSNNSMTQSIGKALYSASIVTITMTYATFIKLMGLDNENYTLAFGGVLYTLAVIMGLGLIISFLVIPIVEDLRINKELRNSLKAGNSEDIIED